MTIKSVIIITHSSCTFFVHTLSHGLKYCFQNKISIKIIKSCLFWQFHNLKTRFQRKCEIASVRISYFVKTGFPSSCMSCIIEVKLWVTLVKIGYYHTWQSSSLAWGGTLGEKYTLDLERLTFCPKISQKESKTSLMIVLFFKSALAKRIRSSANIKCKKARPFLETWRGSQRWEEHLCSIKKLNNSMHMMKRYGERGSSYLMPREGRKGSSWPPLSKTEIKDEATQIMINLMRESRTLNSRSMSLTKFHFSLS